MDGYHCNGCSTGCYSCQDSGASGLSSAGKIEKFRQKVQDLIDCCKIPGAAVSICHCDNVILQEGFGQRDLEDPPNPVTTETIFQLGPVSLSMLAVWYARLSFQGRLCFWQKIMRIGDVRFLGEELAFRASIASALAHEIHFPRRFFESTVEDVEPSSQIFLQGVLKWNQTNPVLAPFNKYILTPISWNNQYIIPSQTADRTGTFLGSDALTELNTLWQTDLNMTSTVYGKVAFEANPNRALPMVYDNCTWLSKYVYDMPNMLFSTGVASNIENMTTFMKLVLNNGIITPPGSMNLLQIYNTSNSGNMLLGRTRDLIPPDGDASQRILSFLSANGDRTPPNEIFNGNTLGCTNDWYNTAGWKIRYYNGETFHYSVGFLETGGSSLIMMNRKHKFAITILTNSLSPFPEALAIYAYYLFNDCNLHKAETEFNESVIRTSNYIRLRTPRNHSFDGPPMDPAINPVGSWFNDFSGKLVVSTVGPNLQFQWQDYAPVIGTNVTRNWWTFNFVDENGIDRFFTINFSYNGASQGVNASAFTYSGNFDLQRTPEITNLCGTFDGGDTDCKPPCYMAYQGKKRCNQCHYYKCKCCSRCQKPCDGYCKISSDNRGGVKVNVRNNSTVADESIQQRLTQLESMLHPSTKSSSEIYEEDSEYNHIDNRHSLEEVDYSEEQEQNVPKEFEELPSEINTPDAYFIRHGKVLEAEPTHISEVNRPRKYRKSRQEREQARQQELLKLKNRFSNIKRKR